MVFREVQGDESENFKNYFKLSGGVKYPFINLLNARSLSLSLGNNIFKMV